MFIDFTKQKIRTVVSAVSIGLISFGGYAQDKAILQVKKETNSQGLNSLQSQFKRESEAAKKRVEEHLRKQSLLRSATPESASDDNSHRELMDVGEDGTLYYYTTYNDGAAKTTRTDKLHPSSGLGYNLTGEGEMIGIWEGSTVNGNHEAFTGRVIVKEEGVEPIYGNIDPLNVTRNDSHADHVGGTLIGAKHADGGRAAGMAPNATLLSYDWFNDNQEIIQAVKDHNLLVSNHSYGWDASYLPKYDFGKYGQYARKMDELANKAPYYLHVKSAGNDRGSNLSDDGYDLIYGVSAAKNILTIAAAEKVEEYKNASSVKMSWFSNWGPTDDGRIKPDISGNGVNVYSADRYSTSAYTTKSGTSMSAPNVSGSLLLLQQYYKRLNGFYMRAATLKGLALHTASEAGRNPGPDYEFGWGLLNAEKAAEAIKNNGELSMIKEINLDNNEVHTFKVRKNSDEPLMVSISWNDLAYNVSPFDTTVDDSTPVLVNDLDIRIIDSENKETLPWKLNPATPSAGATRGDNIVDNIEKIEVVGGAAGEVYTVTITHKGVLTGNQQAVSVVVTGGSRVSGACNLAQWSRSKAYKKGDIVEYLGDRFEAKFWSQGSVPFSNDQWGAWMLLGECGTNNNKSTITLISPEPNTNVEHGKLVQVKASVTNAALSFSSVFLKIQRPGETFLLEPKSVVGNVYTFDYSPNTNREEVLSIVAINEQGVKSTKDLELDFTLNQSPKLELISAQNEFQNNLEAIPVKIKATDIDGAVEKVYMSYTNVYGVVKENIEMLKEGNVYSVVITPENLMDQFDITIVAIDNLGKKSDSVTVQRRIGNGEKNIAPVVFIHTPFEGTTFDLTESLEVELAYTSYNEFFEGPEQLVRSEVYLNGNLIREENYENSHYFSEETTLRISELGAYTVKVRSLDERGAWGEAEVSFEVVKNPEIRFTNLTEGNLYTLNKGELLDVNVEVVKGSSDIQFVEYLTYEYNDINFFPRVEFYSSTEAPYSFQYDPKRGSSEIYITATVVDVNGKTNSASVTIYTEKDKIQPPYPNPTTGIVNIPWDAALGKAIVGVYSSRNIEQFSKTFESGNEFQIDLSALNKGVYFVLVQSKDGFYFKEHKVILE
ncbi:Por secretion system C-terminal sorting domain-containing protein [Tenacibaculum sp. MAR_2009_124]|uniref:S8 family serine peptidase n=1 Tax=Tenacibaculum sp. MAR_2009_124 TaxID=1250059 RepID=UPI00089C1A93|nr:S8 family serine peptidase [Tenacibaculum sp. MAR_2009_124]SEC49269.1 Por secretion system C-terminal sorting domain-containing protein [Tenacibaculum sp. MAR_2009_124]